MVSNRPSGQLVVSLDFELFWGIRDVTTLAKSRARLLGVQQAVPAILGLFAEHDIHCSWATVGLVMADGRAEATRYFPTERPGYHASVFDPYPTVGETGASEQGDPCHYAPTLVRNILETPGQELAVHTFSHYYALERGARPSAFRADLEAWKALALDRYGLAPRSIVFPRNQYDSASLSICKELGLIAYRGNLPQWLFQFGSMEDQSHLRRAVRLIDHYVPVSGNNNRSCADHEIAGLVDVCASRFLRPHSDTLKPLERFRRWRITSDMEHAAKNGSTYHLWWHPHNFGCNLEENLAFLRTVLEQFTALRSRWGMRSCTMAEAAQDVLGAQSAEDS